MELSPANRRFASPVLTDYVLAQYNRSRWLVHGASSMDIEESNDN